MGLYDRDYMRQQSGKNNISGRQMLIYLIVINAICYLLVRPGSPLYKTFALFVDGTFRINYLWQIFTAAFLHASFGHALFNLWGMYLFGSLIAPHLDGKKFLILYLAGAACGNILYLLCNINSPYPSVLVGSSGTVCAIMAAAATLEPNRKFIMFLLPVAPMKTTTLVICYTIMEIFFTLTGSNSNIAHLAHLGGFAGGYLIMKIFFGRLLPWDPFRSIMKKMPSPPQTEAKKSSSYTYSKSDKVSQKELDELLDKLSTSGVNSLSEYELERLRLARRQMRGENG